MFRKSNSRGQAALEYLITYGWAFLVIIASVGVLSYFGLLNPSRYIPASCEFGEQLKCIDHYIDDQIVLPDQDGRIILRFRNNFEEGITVTNVFGNNVTIDGGSVNTDIDKGETKRVEIDVGKPIFPKSKERFELIVQFRRQGGTVLHNISGTVFSEVVDSSLGIPV